jgi:hypothetical protein
MASELRVNTLKDASGNNSVATSVVFAGSAKSWVHFDMSDFSNKDSHNIASITDSGTGLGEPTFTSAMGNALYSGVATGGNMSSSENGIQIQRAQMTTAKYRIEFTAGGSANDTTTMHGQICGDLA